MLARAPCGRFPVISRFAVLIPGLGAYEFPVMRAGKAKQATDAKRIIVGTDGQIAIFSRLFREKTGNDA